MTLRHALPGSLAALLLLSMTAFASSAPPLPNGSFAVDGHTTLVVAASEPSGVQFAVDDLASDMNKVFGVTPTIVHSLHDAGPVAIVIGDLPNSGISAPSTAAPESFSIAVTQPRESNGSPKAVLHLVGADMRGTIYAVYQFSQEFLGIDPMYYWTDHVPVHRASLALSSTLDKQYPAPVFRYRGFFINDEDLLTGWAPGEKKDGTGIRLDVWNKIFETLLRLKANIVVAGTWPFPNEPQAQLATRRGLIVNQHHAEPLGVNAARWPKGVPYNFSTHPEFIENAWKNAVNAIPTGTEVLWSVGLRGLSDQSYAALDPSVRGDDKRLGMLISKAIADQISIVERRFPHAHFVTDLWMEGSRLEHQGLLTIPKNVITIWADTGYGYEQDNGAVASGEGAYFHVAMMNDQANQLTEMVPVDRIVATMSRFQKAGATGMFLVNTSDIRPVAMTARATMDLAWAGAEATTADAYYRKWSTKEFGATAAGAIDKTYVDYFNAPAHQAEDRHPGERPRDYGEQYYHTTARQMMLDTMLQSPLYGIAGQAPKWETPHMADSHEPGESVRIAEREAAACAEAQPRWDAVWDEAVKAEALVPANRREYYDAEMLTMVQINRESNRMLLDLSHAVLALHSGKRDEAFADTQQALRSIDTIQAQESRTEYGKWKNWYHGDWLTGIPRTHQMVQHFAQYIRDPQSPVMPPTLWNDWEAYYHILHYEGDKSVNVEPPSSSNAQ